MTTSEQTQITTTARRLTATERGGRPATVTTISRRYETTADDLWSAVTERDRLARWLGPMDGELRLGGRYQLEGNAGGEVLTCDPPASFSVTWEYGDDVSWVEVRVSATDDGGAHLELVHTGHEAEEFWNRYGPGATGVGWDLGLLGLAWHLAAPAAPRRDDVDTWTTTPDGRAFVAASSERWAEASITFGTEPDQAASAAARTTAFFTGDPEPA